METCQSAGDKLGEAMSLAVLARAQLAAGKLADSAALANDAVTLFKEVCLLRWPDSRESIQLNPKSGKKLKGNNYRRRPDYSSNLCPPKNMIYMTFLGGVFGRFLQEKNRKQAQNTPKKVI